MNNIHHFQETLGKVEAASGARWFYAKRVEDITSMRLNQLEVPHYFNRCVTMHHDINAVIDSYERAYRVLLNFFVQYAGIEKASIVDNYPQYVGIASRLIPRSTTFVEAAAQTAQAEAPENFYETFAENQRKGKKEIWGKFRSWAAENIATLVEECKAYHPSSIEFLDTKVKISVFNGLISACETHIRKYQ